MIKRDTIYKSAWELKSTVFVTQQVFQKMLNKIYYVQSTQLWAWGEEQTDQISSLVEFIFQQGGGQLVRQ